MTEEYAELEGFDEIPEEDDPRDEPTGGIREPKKPIKPYIPGGIALEKEKELVYDLCCSS